MPVPIPDTRPLFRPLTADVVALLRWLSPEDTALRRLSYHRDRMLPPSPGQPIASEHDLAALINELNATWVRAARRLSPRVLADLYATAALQLCDFIETLPLDAPPLFPVSWAGGHGSEGWLDIGRELTEVWHHGAQVREAVGAGPFPDASWLQAVLTIAVQALPHAYRDVGDTTGGSLIVDITGRSGGVWTLRRESSGWDVSAGTGAHPTARATMSDDIAWRLFFNALGTPAEAAVRLDGDLELARPLLRVRSVIV